MQHCQISCNVHCHWDRNATDGEFKLVTPGNFDSNVQTIRFRRTNDLSLEVVGTGSPETGLRMRATGMKSGEVMPSAPTAVAENYYWRIHLENAHVRRQARDESGNPIQYAYPTRITVESRRNPNPAVSLSDWVLNFPHDSFVVPPRATNRTLKTSYQRTRSEDIEVELQEIPVNGLFSEFARVRCEWNGVERHVNVGKVFERYAEETYKPGFIEYRVDPGELLPSEDSRQRVATALSLAVGRELQWLGTTGLDESGNGVFYVYRSLHLPRIKLEFRHLFRRLSLYGRSSRDQ